MAEFITSKTEHDYKLTIHAAGMLTEGLHYYYKLIKRLYRNKIEDADYCDLMLWTAKTEAQRLLTWMNGLDTVLVKIQMYDLELLIEKISKFRSKI